MATIPATRQWAFLRRGKRCDYHSFGCLYCSYHFRGNRCVMALSMNILLILVSAILILPIPAWGWDFTKRSVKVEDIISGGPPKDGIPALFNPKYVPVKKADFMKESEDVIGVELNGVAHAYPIRIMSWHELINDRFGDRLVLVSW